MEHEQGVNNGFEVSQADPIEGWIGLCTVVSVQPKQNIDVHCLKRYPIPVKIIKISRREGSKVAVMGMRSCL